MGLKRVLIGATFFLLLISLLQVLPVPPYSNDLYPVFKSEYFKGLDTRAGIIAQSFLGVKIYGKPEAAWIHLQDIEKKYGLQLKVYDKSGRRIIAPGLYGTEKPSVLRGMLPVENENIRGVFENGMYISVVPLPAQDHCSICHNVKKGETMGILTVKQEYNPLIIYTVERIIIFLFISLMLMGILVILWRWDPQKNVKELFDKI